MYNYSDYYNYLGGYNDMNFMTSPNSMISDMNSNIFPTNQITNQNITETMTGFKRGNMFNNLYSEYKNYKPQELKASNEREDLIMQIDEQRFAMIDLGLYLDIYPNDRNALSLFNNALNKKKELVNLYESKYGPLTLDSSVQTNSWLWDNSPWAWEVSK